MSEKRSTLNISDFVKAVEEIRGRVEKSGLQFSQSVNDLINTLLAIELSDYLESKLKAKKEELIAKLGGNQQKQQTLDLGLPLVLNEKTIELLKNTDLDTLIKLKLLLSPSTSGDALAVIALLSSLGKSQNSSGSSGITIGELLKIVEKAYEKTPYKELIELYSKLIESNPHVVELRKEIEELKKKVESSDPITFIKSLRELANELGLTQKSGIEYEIEKMKLDLEKWKLEQEMKLRRLELLHKLKRAERLEVLKERENLMKYIIAPLVRMAVSKLGKVEGKKLEEVMKLPTTKVKCPRCGNEFIVKANPDGNFPDVVTCPYCGLKLRKKTQTQSQTQVQQQQMKGGEHGEGGGQGEERKEE